MVHRVPRVAVALVVVTAGLLTIVLHHGSSTDRLSGGAHTVAEAGRRAMLVLDRAYVLGAVRDPSPKGSLPETTDGGEVHVRRWYTVAGNLDTVVALMSANPPAGFAQGRKIYSEVSDSGSGSGSIVEFDDADPRAGSTQTLDVVAISLTGQRVSLRIDAIVDWVPLPTT